MTRTDFIDYLLANGCEIVREAKKGYCVIRNAQANKISGIPSTDPPLPATVCRICKTLQVVPPDAAKDAQGIIDHMQNEFDQDRFSPNNGNL